MKHLIRAIWILALIAVVAVAGPARAADLYEVSLHSQFQAQQLATAGVDPIFAVNGGYLVLADNAAARAMQDAGLDCRLIATRIERSDIAVDRRPSSRMTDTYPVLYEQDRLRLVRIDNAAMALAGSRAELFPLRDTSPLIQYFAPSRTPLVASGTMDVIDTLVQRISQDSLTAYLTRLTDFTHRLTGTDSNYAARDWILDKFQSFGYDSVYYDTFTGSQLWDRVPCVSHNVIAVKPGSVTPDQQVIIGAHFDAVPDCPGADDNGSGTCCVLEAARVLADIDMPMTVVFIAFDSEESWMWGSYHYRDVAVARGDNIQLMLNPDMIAHYQNSDSANLYHGAQDGYARLWNELAGPLVGIHGHLAGSTASDHLPFQEVGIPVVFVQEGTFSTEYHTPTDDLAHISFPYMTNMVKATVATLYTATTLPPMVQVTTLWDVGNGASLQVDWEPIVSSNLAGYRVYWDSDTLGITVDSIDVPYGDSTAQIGGLMEGIEYNVWMKSIDLDGKVSISGAQMAATPYSAPQPPTSLTVLPMHGAIRITWTAHNKELDFDHYAVVRDGTPVVHTGEQLYIDSDPSLGTDYHVYTVASVDLDGNLSDTAITQHATIRAAELAPNRILAVNRTKSGDHWSDESATGALLREALAGSDFDYRSDTMYTTDPALNPTHLWMDDLISYGTVVIGCESVADPFTITNMPFLDSLAWYVSIGGRLAVFGRFGTMFTEDFTDRFDLGGVGAAGAYDSVFHLASRTTTATAPSGQSLVCDMIGAHSQVSGYPALTWDSLATINQCAVPLTGTGGIWASTFGQVNTGAEVIYTYDSRTDDPEHEGQPVAWRYIGPDYRYVWIEMPLSCMQHDDAIATIRQAVNDLNDQATGVDDPHGTKPVTFSLHQNYPNPFNPTTRIDYSLDRGTEVRLTIYNLLGQEVRVLVDAYRPAGNHSVEWNGRNGSGQAVATGVYLYRIEAGDRRASRKMLLLK